MLCSCLKRAIEHVFSTVSSSRVFRRMLISILWTDIYTMNALGSRQIFLLASVSRTHVSLSGICVLYWLLCIFYANTLDHRSHMYLSERQFYSNIAFSICLCTIPQYVRSYTPRLYPLFVDATLVRLCSLRWFTVLPTVLSSCIYLYLFLSYRYSHSI